MASVGREASTLGPQEHNGKRMCADGGQEAAITSLLHMRGQGELSGRRK